MENQETATKKFVKDWVNKQNKEGETVLLIGDAPKQLNAVEPNQLRLSGTINAPAEFYNKLKDLHDKNKCHVIYNIKNGTILLVVDENFNKVNTEVKGTMIKNPDLQELKINHNYKYGVKELMQTLKFNRLLFANQEENMKVVMQLQNFKAKVEKEITNMDDQRGNEAITKIQKLETGLQERFVLETEIYKGTPKKRFEVEILCQITSNDLQVWLESRELKEIEQKAAEEEIQKQLTYFSDVVCIEQ